MQTTQERVMQIFKKLFDIEPDLDADLVNDHNLDSLDHIELIMEAEVEFNITIDDLRSQEVKTPADLIRVVDGITGAA